MVPVLVTLPIFLKVASSLSASLCPDLLFVMPTDKSARAPTCPSDLASASEVIVLGSSDTSPLTALSSQGVERRRYWFNTLGGDNPRPRKLFSENNARNVDAVADLLVAIIPFSSAIANAVLHDRITSRRSSPARWNSSQDFDGAVAAAPRVPSLPVVSTSILGRSDRRPPPVSSALVTSSRQLIA